LKVTELDLQRNLATMRYLEKGVDIDAAALGVFQARNNGLRHSYGMTELSLVHPRLVAQLVYLICDARLYMGIQVGNTVMLIQKFLEIT
jgi:hypothetical protein